MPSFLAELKGFEIVSDDKNELSEADRLNGLRELHFMALRFSASRLSEHRGTATYHKWNEWKTPGASGGIRYPLTTGGDVEFLFRLKVQLLDIGWKVTWQRQVKQSFDAQGGAWQDSFDPNDPNKLWRITSQNIQDADSN